MEMPRENVLEMARRHVRDGEGLVARQAEILGDLRRHGHDTQLAEALLQTLENTLQQMRQHLAYEEQQERRG